MIKRLFIILTIVAFSLCVHAQVLPTLKITNITANGVTGFPDTIYGGTAYSYLITVANMDSSQYVNDTSFISGVFTIRAQQADASLPAFDLYSSNSAFVINGSDSIIFQVTDSFGTGFKLGNNVVVVWPSKVGAGAQPFNIDSTYYSIYFVGSSGISDVTMTSLKVYPNPFNQYLNISNNNEEPTMVCIYDVQSHLVWQQPFISNKLDVSFLKEGLYFIELKKRDTVLARGKVLKVR